VSCRKIARPVLKKLSELAFAGSAGVLFPENALTVPLKTMPPSRSSTVTPASVPSQRAERANGFIVPPIRRTPRWCRRRYPRVVACSVTAVTNRAW